MPKVQKDSWANYQTVTYCSSACNGAIKEYHPLGSEFGKEKGRYKKQRDIALALCKCLLYRPVFITLLAKIFTALNKEIDRREKQALRSNFMKIYYT